MTALQYELSADPVEHEEAPPQTPEEAQRRFLAYFEASVREVVDRVYPLRFKYHDTSQGPLWEVEYQAWSYAEQFVLTLADIDDEELRVYRQQFAEAVLMAVKLKINRKDIL